MFDPVGIFARQFTPTDGGFLYYPSKKSGGKLITDDEHERLVAQWQRVAGRKGMWTTVGIIFVLIFLWTFLSESFALPNWTDGIVTTVCVVGVSIWLLWASWAPRRLVRDRPDIAPPRSSQEARREARSLLSWRMILFCLVFSGAIFLGKISSPDRTLASWAWLVASGVALVGYVWIAIQKLADRRR